MVCYLIRHGQDNETVRGGWSGHPLTDAGICQSEQLAEWVEGLDIRRIYSSDLPRAMQTARILGARLHLTVEPLSQFREVNNGDLAGMENDIALQRYPGLFWNRMQWEQCYPNGESPRAFYERICDGWADLTEKMCSNHENAILVTHGGVIHVIRTILENRPYSNAETHKKVKHAEVIALSYLDGAWIEM